VFQQRWLNDYSQGAGKITRKTGNDRDQHQHQEKVSRNGKGDTGLLHPAQVNDGDKKDQTHRNQHAKRVQTRVGRNKLGYP